jgi:hypothetical protein
MSASSYRRVLNRNLLRTHSTATSAAVAATITYHRRSRAAASGARPDAAVAAAAGAWCSLLMLTGALSYRGMLPSRLRFQTRMV